MSLIDNHQFDKRRGLSGLETDYHLVRTSCCGAFGVEEHELGMFYFDPVDLSRFVLLLEDHDCPFCGRKLWAFKRIEEFSSMPQAWRWAAPSDLRDVPQA